MKGKSRTVKVCCPWWKISSECLRLESFIRWILPLWTKGATKNDKWINCTLTNGIVGIPTMQVEISERNRKIPTEDNSFTVIHYTALCNVFFIAQKRWRCRIAKTYRRERSRGEQNWKHKDSETRTALSCIKLREKGTEEEVKAG